MARAKLDNTVFVYAPDFTLLTIIKSYESLIFNRSWYEIGSFSIKCATSVKGVEHLFKHENIIVVGRRGDTAGIITGADLELSRGKSTITARGLELKSIAQRRNTIGPTESEDANAFGWDRIGASPAELVLRHYIENNITNPQNKDRKIPQAILEPVHDPPVGMVTVWQSRLEKLHDVLAEIGQWCDIGWGLRFDVPHQQWVFEVLPGRDMTADGDAQNQVVFKLENNTLSQANYKFDYSAFTNAIYAGGAGEDERRFFQTIYYDGKEYTEYPTIGLGRIETLIDVGNLDEPDEMTEQATHRHKSQARPVDSFSFALSNDGPYVYREDYDLGDKVTVSVHPEGFPKAIRMDARILNIQETYERGKPSPQVDPTVGNAPLILSDLFKNMNKQTPVR